ncbi:copper amine oxidase N-terminal domain-containing protein [Peptococcus simiae]|uniref:Copper amine oxidase N-terminal domain-containing protein n=1 Tax=Peptococcus simiae TaxID=1643805 RepID=A0ABW9H167_9FIRM
MKKTTKKVVSLLTILSFLLTLVPAAVFAADTTPAKDASFVEVEDSTVDVGGSTEVRVGLKAAAGADATVAGYDIVVWAGSTTSANDTVEFTGAEKANDNITGVYKITEVKDGLNAVKAKFNKSGSYQLNAAIVPTDKLAGLEKVSDLAQYRISTNEAAKVTVESSNVIKAFAVYNDNGALLAEFNADESVSNKEITVNANGLTPTKLVVKAWKDKEKTIAADRNTEVRFDTNSANLKLNTTSEKISYKGEAEVKLTGDVYGTYKLYIAVGDVEGTLNKVIVSESVASTIETSKTAAKAFAWDADFRTKGMEDFVQFIVKDINGNVIQDTPADEPAFVKQNSDTPYVKVLDKPSNMKVDDKDFYLKKVDGKDYFTLVANKELKVGKYTVQVALKNGKKAVASFEIAKFGTAKELKIDYNTETVQLGDKNVKAPDIVFVDENGVQKKAAKRVSLGYAGYAVEDFKTEDGSFKVKGDEKYLGSKIVVTAVAEREGLVAKANLTVAQDGRSMKFASNKGVVGANNKVDFQLVDGDGKTVSLGGNYENSAVVIEKVSDDTAKVSASVTAYGDLKEKGIGTLSLTSDKPVTADIAVYVSNQYGKFYAGNLTYTFGKDVSNVGRAVVMTIGSKDVIVDNNVVAIDTAAIIKNERTFVPFRALAEAFGAKVDWNEKDKTVTTELDGKKIVMTVDKKEYKVNDKEMTMDVAPYINGDSRTMIPVRFAAEGLGFTVTPTYNTDGTTASVVFIK